MLIWGASGGLGSYATQLALNGGATPVCVVSSPEKAELCRRMGAELVIDRAAEGYRFWTDEQTQDPTEWRRFGERIRELTGGEDPDIVFEHPGRETFGRERLRGQARRHDRDLRLDRPGSMHQYDNRYLWMNLKRIIGCHFANYREAWEANRLIALGPDPPDAVQDVPAGADRPGRVRGAPQRAPGQGRRAVPGPGRGPRRTRRRTARPAPGRASTASADALSRRLPDGVDRDLRRCVTCTQRLGFLDLGRNFGPIGQCVPVATTAVR